MTSKANLRKMKKMFNGDLPIVNAEVPVDIKSNPETGKIKYIYGTIPVEVLSVNFNTGKMKVRYIATLWTIDDNIEIRDIDNTPYLEKYNF